jgi:hypothetical protein
MNGKSWEKEKGKGGGGISQTIRPLRPGEQVVVDVKNATQRACACGCKYFIAVATVYTVSALISPTGMELTVQQPALICLECKTPLQLGNKEGS